MVAWFLTSSPSRTDLKHVETTEDTHTILGPPDLMDNI